ncbi:MAG: hypothetical protein OEY37_09540 [Gammaproteobacteria bacterium]|nr:hypothetical protein [Gammaproteobacteria bacterium]
MNNVSERGAWHGVVAAFVSVLVLGQVVNADDAGEHLAAPFDDMIWQTAEAADMALFEPFIGTFTSDDKAFPNGTGYRFIIDYSWYDDKKTIVKYTLEIEFPEKEDIRPIGEGYYRLDPLSRRIEVVGVFRDGRSGAGFMTPFDVETGSREVRIRTLMPDGVEGEVRDTFWVIDQDTWGNRTFMRSGNAPWRQVSEDVYHREVS